jgi:hypothetical protein
MQTADVIDAGDRPRGRVLAIDHGADLATSAA